MTLKDVKLTLVDNLDEVDAFRRWMGERRPHEVLGIDTETTGLDFWIDHVRMIQIGDAQQGWSIPTEMWKGLAKELILKWEGDWVMHNAKFDMNMLRAEGIDIPWSKVHDTMIMAALVEPNKPKGLKPLSARWVDRTALAGQEMLDVAMTKNHWTWATVPFDCPPYWIYSALDPVLTTRMFDVLMPKAMYAKHAYDIEMGALGVLAQMEWHGVKIDPEYCMKTLSRWQSQIADMRLQCQKVWSVDNPTSNEQVYRRLIADGVQLVKFTATGKPQLTEEILESIEHPLAKLVLRIRKLTKMSSTYLEAFLTLKDSNDRLHASIWSVAARTGRMSVTRPALQTLPRSFEVRHAFVPEEGNLMVMSDFQQVELRVMASYAQEQKMIETFMRGQDMHTYTAEQVFADRPIPQHKRQIAKNGNFAKIYGAGIAKFALTCGISEEESRAFLTAYDRAFPNVAQFQRAVTNQVMRRLRDEKIAYITTFGGRRIPIDRGKEYVGVNYLIQGSCADILKRKLCELDAAGLGDYMVLPVHDEVVFDVPRDEAEEVQRIVAETMRDDQSFIVPLEVDVETSTRWGFKYPYDLMGEKVTYEQMEHAVAA